jgi:MFS family permease
VPGICMAVLFDEISEDLDLSLAQVGLIWGIGSLPGLVMGLVGGAIGDRFGPKRILTAACLLVGSTGALRGLSTDFVTLAAASGLLGLWASSVPMNIFKTCGLWFPRQQLGLANGVISMGMALGFMVSSLISATLLSPWLGSWRYVLVLYGAIAMCLCLPWYFTRPAPATADLFAGDPRHRSLGETLSYVSRIRKMWLMGWAILGIGGCIQGTLGYLPLYLRDMGWPESRADGAAATFHLASLILVIPIALWSDKVGSRKKVLVAAALMISTGVGLLSVTEGILVWGAVIMTGMVRDGFMALFMTMIIETDGVGAAYAGTATGFVMVFSGLGNLLAPPLGNSLARIAPSLPFVFWATLAVVGLFGLYSAKEEAVGKALEAQPTV